MSKKDSVDRKTYQRIHCWLRKNYGKAIKCDNTLCLKKSIIFTWALKRECNYECKRDNFKMLCKSCHSKEDCTEETRRKMSIIGRRKTMSSEAKRMIGLSRLGKKMSDETKEKIRVANLGIKKTLETRKRMSISAKRRNYKKSKTL